MNYRCEELAKMIEHYEETQNADELISRLKRHIAEWGEIYDVVGISKDDFEQYGYNTEKLDGTMLSTIARKIDIGDTLTFAIEYWAERFGLPKTAIDGQE